MLDFEIKSWRYLLTQSPGIVNIVLSVSHHQSRDRNAMPVGSLAGAKSKLQQKQNRKD